ncbi:calcium-binding protein [Rhizobium sp.]
MPTFNVYTPSNPETLFNETAVPGYTQYTFGTGLYVDYFDYGNGIYSADGVHTRFIGNFQGHYDDGEWYVDSGTVTALQIVTEDGYPLVEISDINMNVAEAFAQIVQLSPTAFRDWMNTRSWTFNGSAGNDTLTGGSKDDEINAHSGSDIASGFDGNDDIFGGSGADTLSGGAGKDLLDGGKGVDILTGGKSADIFVMATRYGKDVIEDFANGIDRIDVSDWKAIDNFKDIKSHLVKSGDDVVIKVGDDWLTIVDTVKGDINAADFIF